MKNWQTKKIGQIIELHYGKGISKFDRNESAEYPIYGANGVLGKTNKTWTSGEAIIIGRKGSAGEVIRVSGKFWPSDVTYYVFGNNELDIDYLFYFFKYTDLTKLAVGVKPGINRNRVYEIEIPLPPLAEQKKIVARLDVAFGKIKEAKRLREETLVDTEQILASTLHEIFEEGKKQGWEETTIENISNVFTDGDWIESKDQSPNGIRLIQTGNVGNGFFKNKEGRARYVSKETFEKLGCTEIFAGDLLVSRLPDPIGRACLLPALNVRTITAVDCTIIRVSSKKIISTFLMYFTASPFYFNQIDRLISGSTRKRISRKNLGNIKILVPSLAEQKKIIVKLNVLSEKVRALGELQKAQLADLKSLEQALLREAFEGKLV